MPQLSQPNSVCFTVSPTECDLEKGLKTCAGATAGLVGFLTIKVPQSERPHSLGLLRCPTTEDTHHIDELLKGQLSAAIFTEHIHYASTEWITSELIYF